MQCSQCDTQASHDFRGLSSQPTAQARRRKKPGAVWKNELALCNRRCLPVGCSGATPLADSHRRHGGRRAGVCTSRWNAWWSCSNAARLLPSPPPFPLARTSMTARLSDVTRDQPPGTRNVRLKSADGGVARPVVLHLRPPLSGPNLIPRDRKGICRAACRGWRFGCRLFGDIQQAIESNCAPVATASPSQVSE